MKRVLTSAIACLFFAGAYAQLDETKNFLYLYSDSVVYAQSIYLERDFRGMPYFRVDGRRVHPEQVRFFNSEEGFYANTSSFGLTGQTMFSERIRKGKINIYEEQFIQWDNYHSYYAPYREPEVAFTKNYYNVDLGPLKKATYTNLKSDMANDPESLNLLGRYKTVKKAERNFYLAAGTSIAAGMISFVVAGAKKQTLENHSFPNFGPSFLLLGAGAGFGITGFIKTLKAPRYLKAAVDGYNR